MTFDRALTEKEVSALERFLKKDHPPVLPPDLKILAITLEEAGLLKIESGQIHVSNEARRLVELAKDKDKD